MSRLANGKKPRIKLIGKEANAWSIMGRARDALKKAGATKEELHRYGEEARSGDYNNLLRVTMDWCECD